MSDSQSSPRALAARDVAHRYDGVLALDRASISVGATRALALVGESGSGKTTLLRCFNRMVDPDSGTVEVGGIGARSQPVIALRRHIGYVPQDGGLLPHWRVLRNVALVPRLLQMDDPEAAAAQALRIVGLSVDTFGTRYPHELSGGQRQRVALARALAARPGVILLDEPFAALDAITRANVYEVFQDVRRELPMTMLLVTHDLAEAAHLADEIAVMRSGRVEQQGTMLDLHSAPATTYVVALIARAVATSAHLVAT
jgi:osmoprotectant transport system ATP-binding protein